MDSVHIKKYSKRCNANTRISRVYKDKENIAMFNDIVKVALDNANPNAKKVEENNLGKMLKSCNNKTWCNNEGFDSVLNPKYSFLQKTLEQNEQELYQKPKLFKERSCNINPNSKLHDTSNLYSHSNMKQLNLIDVMKQPAQSMINQSMNQTRRPSQLQSRQERVMNQPIFNNQRQQQRPNFNNRFEINQQLGQPGMLQKRAPHSYNDEQNQMHRFSAISNLYGMLNKQKTPSHFSKKKNVSYNNQNKYNNNNLNFVKNNNTQQGYGGISRDQQQYKGQQ